MKLAGESFTYEGLHTGFSLLREIAVRRVRPLENSETVYHKANNFEELRERFSRVLLESEYYDKDKVRERLLHTDLYEEQVILQEKVCRESCALNQRAVHSLPFH